MPKWELILISVLILIRIIQSLYHAPAGRYISSSDSANRGRSIIRVIPIWALILISVSTWGFIFNFSTYMGGGRRGRYSDWNRSGTYIELLFLISVPTWAWIIICTGILFVLGCVLACIFRRRICKLKNSTTEKQGLIETTKLQKVALLGKCHMEKVGQHVYIIFFYWITNLVKFSLKKMFFCW